MTYATYPSSTPGKNFNVIAVDHDEDTITIQHPDGRTKTIPRPADYDEVKGRVNVRAPVAAKPAKAKREGAQEYDWAEEITIRDGALTVRFYRDGHQEAKLTERWKEPLTYLSVPQQERAQRAYDAFVKGKKGWVRLGHPKKE